MSKAIDLVTDATSAFEPTKEHTRLAALVGTWAGNTTTWFDPSKPPEEAHTTMRAESILGGRFLRLQYTGTAMGKPHAGEMLIAYEKDTKSYSFAWVDSFHTGTALMLSVGDATADDSAAISVLGSYFAGEGQPRWGWRTVLHPNPESFVLEAFNIDPDGKEYPALKTRFERS